MSPSANHSTGERDSSRVPGLDGLRGIAILLVMLFHFTYMKPLAVWDVPLYMIGRYGWTGVDLFFVLSGFLITGILLNAKGSEHYFRNFYVRRILRIFPLYYTFVAGLLVLYPLVGDPSWTKEAKILWDHQWWFWLHMTNWLVVHTGDFWTATTLNTGGFWSLAVQEQFYFVWPVLVLFLSERRLLWTCGGMFFAGLIIRLAMTATGSSWAAVNSITFGRIDSYSTGAALAVLARSPGGLSALRPYVLPMFIFSVLSFVMIEVVLHVIDHPNYTLVLAVQLTPAATLWGALLVSTMNASPKSIGSRFLQSAVLRSFGKYSFALYLFHGHLNRWFEKAGLDIEGRGATPILGSILPHQLLYIGLGIGISYLFAFLSWHLYEKQFLRLKALFPSGHVRPAITHPQPLSQETAEPAKETCRAS